MVKSDAALSYVFGGSGPMFPVGAAPRKRCTQHKGRLRRAYKSVFCRDDKKLSRNLSTRLREAAAAYSTGTCSGNRSLRTGAAGRETRSSAPASATASS